MITYLDSGSSPCYNWFNIPHMREDEVGKVYVDIRSGERRVEPDFVKVYIGDVCKLHGLTSNQTSIFNFMLLNMNSRNESLYSTDTKKEFLKFNGMKNQTFDNNVAALVKAGLVKRISRGQFIVNKKYAVKTDWTKVQSIKWGREYSADGSINESVVVEDGEKQ